MTASTLYFNARGEEALHLLADLSEARYSLMRASFFVSGKMLGLER